MIGALAIYAYNTHALSSGERILTADAIVLWFLIPILDCGRLIVSRMLQGKSPFVADRNHLHHLLIQKMSSKQALICYFALVGAPIVISILAQSYTPVLVLAEMAVYWATIWYLSPRREATSARVLPFPSKVLAVARRQPVSANSQAVVLRDRADPVVLHKQVPESLPAQKSANASHQVPLSNVGY